MSIIKDYARYAASHYRLVPVVLTRGDGVFVFDVNGKAYFDFNTTYSSMSFGHGNPRLVAALTEQAKRLSVVSAAFYHDKMVPLVKKLCELSRHERAVLMNTGAEAAETAIKIARRYGYFKKQIEPEKAEIIAFSNNFHGRTLATISLSTNEAYKEGFGPLLPGIRIATFGSIEDTIQQISKNTCAILVEPIKGESGVNVPPPGFLKDLEQLCKDHDILLVLDEVQSGIGRAGGFMPRRGAFACFCCGWKTRRYGCHDPRKPRVYFWWQPTRLCRCFRSPFYLRRRGTC